MAQKVDLSQQNIYGLPVVYTRTNGQPMEETLVWYSLSDAEAYAKTAKAYVGQVLTVVTNNGTENAPSYSSKVYVINDAAGTLKETGGGYVIAGQKADTTLGEKVTAEGYDTTASGNYSHAEGSSCSASGSASHAEGSSCSASGPASHAEGSGTKASDNCCHSEGYLTTASSHSAHAEGYQTKASGVNNCATGAHAEGYSTRAQGEAVHVEGYKTTALGRCSHAEGSSSAIAGEIFKSATNGISDILHSSDDVSTLDAAWEDNNFSLAFGSSSHVEGTNCVAYGQRAHAEGYKTRAFSDYSHAEGYLTRAGNYTVSTYTNTSTGSSRIETTLVNPYAHAEGYNTNAYGTASHTEGYKTRTYQADYSHAEGYDTICYGDNQHAQGHLNKCTDTTGSTDGTSGTAFMIGNGTRVSTDVTSPSNALRVQYDGNVYTYDANGKYNAGGADYAEFFEWLDMNVDTEDRRGYFVSLDGEKIKTAAPGDYILGIVSGQPAIVGNADEDWQGRFIRDEFGAAIPEKYEYERTIIDEETGEEKTIVKTGTRYKENPDYDQNMPYIQRADRPEWDAVGMMGVLSVRDDGTCQVNGYCTVAEGGIATASESGYRVIKRVNDHIVKVIFR